MSKESEPEARHFKVYWLDLFVLSTMLQTGEHHYFTRSWPVDARVASINLDPARQYAAMLLIEHPSFAPIPLGEKIPQEHIRGECQSLWRDPAVTKPLRNEAILIAAYPHDAFQADPEPRVYKGFYDEISSVWFIYDHPRTIDFAPCADSRVIAWKPWPEPPPLDFLQQVES